MWEETIHTDSLEYGSPSRGISCFTAKMTIWSIRVRGQPYQVSPFIDTDLIFERQVLMNPYAAETAIVPTVTGCNTTLSRGPVKD